jgi:uncharacterized membrane protein
MMGGFGGAGMLLWIVLIVAVIWRFTQAASRKAEPTRPAGLEHTPKAILDERLARGEITAEQYRSLRKEIE